ncbi:GTPase HflX [Candidatus Brachybacter algidus]|uniref:GTPase HflX n=1 Tax=Candidatus Brachybacter algidus TaxID=2982024 RepID=UPI001D2A41C1|nr:GTPase HflX [Candidatus Brachybacter algidus]MBK6372666.1 GTPase HflX [Candidatus Brachybacter algidus]MBK6448362.1 GTPase HflX [Candidatus Brachybacter algidus]MBK8749612.1 GTPase HflX [Candidatus Brachybacter algidus]MBK9396335.1 GTPase HflX [Candidatus Brachybacter algidus]MBL0118423.1 GTPase HflX [Candidatus Brachybacter algidus]
MAEWNVGQKSSGLLRETERAVIVGVVHGFQTEEKLNDYLDELTFLAETAGAVTLKRFVQKLPHPDNRTFVGKGKAEEIREYILNNDVDLVIFDDDLTGKQVNILEALFKRKIVDRSTLILDIFAERAQTAQARTQVELAQMQYMLPRLRGLWTHLERQQGGIGMRGPGEKEIETDRRIVNDKIKLLKDKLELIDRQNVTQRKNRSATVRVALVGYTNVGKSTIMNVLSDADVFVENKLFATLDTTVRKIVINKVPFLLSDTVGFIRKLPHHLVESFKSTLDEVRESDILVHVVDMSNPRMEDQLITVQQTLVELGAQNIPTFIVGNKIDAYKENLFDAMLTNDEKAEILEEHLEHFQSNYPQPWIFTSAITKENFDELKEKIYTMVKNIQETKFPHLKNDYDQY